MLRWTWSTKTFLVKMLMRPLNLYILEILFHGNFFCKLKRLQTSYIIMKFCVSMSTFLFLKPLWRLFKPMAASRRFQYFRNNSLSPSLSPFLVPLFCLAQIQTKPPGGIPGGILGVTLGVLWVTVGDMGVLGVILGYLGVTWGYSGVTWK